MKRSLIFLVLALSLAACAAPAATPPPITTEPFVPQPPTETPTPAPLPLSFDAVPYRDETVGFELSYPAAWSVSSPTTLGDRADLVEFTAPDGSILSLTIYRWDPAGDLAAYTAQRRLAWEASGIVILEEQSLLLVSGLPAAGFLIQASDGAQAYLFYVPVADRYLEFSGTVAPELVTEIVSTVRTTDE